MYFLELKCKLITPMFMAGADGRTPELRPSEFKGMMRWWWRAIKAEDNIDKLRKEEAEIFGGTERGEGRSKIRIKIESKIESSDITYYQPLPHHKRNSCPIDKQKDCRKAFTSKAIRYDKKVDIIFSFPENLTAQMESLIYLTFTLGGFGKRSRRGFGSIEIIKPTFEINTDNLLNALNKINNSYEINTSSFISGIQVIKNKKYHGGDYPWIREVILSKKEFDSSDDVLRLIGLASHKHRDPSLGNANPRMASPVYVSVVKIKNKLHPIITILNSAFPTKDRYNIQKQKDFIKEFL
ncbi:MAG: type III-B CRISPR module RAMP protein Cmr1 [Thermodesulfovibrio sp.]|nr:type III-B CRISPR module RAMP protein Cmr1 [Thermodesulfovibrio sp.]